MPGGQKTPRTRGTDADGLTGPELRLLEATLKHGTSSAAAKDIGLAERTARRWAAKPAFQAALKTERRGFMEGLATQLAAGTPYILTRLRRVLDDPATPATAIVAAVRVWIENARGTNSDASVAQRLEKLERLLEGRAPSSDEPEDHEAEPAAEQLS